MAQTKAPGWVIRLREVLDGKEFGTGRLAEMLRELNGGKTPNAGSVHNVRAYTKGRVRNPRPAVMRLIAEALGVRYEWLMDGITPMTHAEEHLLEMERQYGQGVPHADVQMRALKFFGGESPGEPEIPAVFDLSIVAPAFFLTLRRLAQLRSPALGDEDVLNLGTKLRMHMNDFLGLATELNGGKARPVKWHTDVALSWLSTLAVTAAFDRMED